MMSAVAASVHPVSFDDLTAFSTLFRTYCTDYAALAPFYAGDYRTPAARIAAADRAAAVPRDRDTLADALLAQNERWGLDDATRRNIEALRDPEAVVVVTGQQVGLFSGPLYTIYRTLTTLKLARQVAEETGRRVVPVFWMPGEDHDLDEVASTLLLRSNDLVPLRYTGHTLPDEGNLGPVGRLALTAQVHALVEALDAGLPPTDFKATVLGWVRDTYRPGTPMLDAFARLLKHLFAGTGLVFMAPDDARLKALAAPLFRREIEDHGTAAEVLEATSARLVVDGYHAQVQTRPTNLFLLADGQRLPLDAEGGTFRLRGTDRTFMQAELLALLDQEPTAFSPNVVLRPLMQDLLLPTVAYVAGPGETAYYAQYKGVYDWAEVPMPLVYPRVSVTLVEGKVQKVLDRYDLAVGDLHTEIDKLFRAVVLAQMTDDVEVAFKAAMQPLHQAINTLKPVIEGVDRSLVKSAEATRAALMKEVGRLKERVIKAEKRNQDVIRDQLEKAMVNLYPAGKPQERALSVLYFLNKYSPALLEDLQAALPLDTTQHYVVAL